MTQSYERAGERVVAMVTMARLRWHKVLTGCEVTVEAVFVDDVNEETGESSQTLKAHGYPAAATIAITPLKYRVLGVGDALMTIDAYSWAQLDEDERLALVDHELEHVQVRAAERGFVGWVKGALDRSARLDDHRRPVLKLRHHDWELGGFRAIARRHKSAAIEVKAARSHREESGQYAWDFVAQRIADDDRPLADVPDGELLDRMTGVGVTSVTAEIDGKSKTVELPKSPLARRRADMAAESEHPEP